jgi:LysM repeat protein
MLDRSPARFVAPLVLAGAAVAIVLVIKNSHPTSSSGGATTATTTTVRTQHKPRPRHRFYVVKPGDVLSKIAGKYGLSTQALEELNPKLDPQTLQAGQRVRLR